MIIQAIFTSVWDGGYEIKTACNVNTETKEVFNIVIADVGELVETLDKEYVTFNGEDHAVYERDEAGEDDYWHE